MAAKKKTRAASRGKQTAAKAKKKPAVHEQWSILLFGASILVGALTFVPGEAGWAWLRSNVLFGVFGVSTYLLAPVLLYLAVRIAMGHLIGRQVMKAVVGLALLSGTFLVFSHVDLTGLTFSQGVAALFENGKSAWYGSGVLGALFGWTLLALCGRPGANILLGVLVLVGIMVITGVTPGDLYYYFSGKATRARESGARIASERAERRRQREEQLEAERLAQQEAAAAQPAAFDAEAYRQASDARRRASIDIDLGADAVNSTELREDERPIIGPGGTFGMNAVPPLQKSVPVSAPMPGQPVVDDFEGAPDVPPWAEPEAAVDAEPSDEQALSDEQSIESLVRKAAVAEEEPQPDAVAAAPMPSMPTDGYMYPPLSLFQKQQAPDEQGIEEELTRNADLLVKTLESFGVKTRLLDISRGPSVTRYELQPLAGVKISRITGLADDIALNLATAGVRIEAPIPGKAAVGIEIPNQIRNVVNIRSIFESPVFSTSKAPLTFAIGKDIAGQCQIGNLAKMPHLLIAGTTGSGKSVCTNSIIMSFLYRCSPKMLRMILIDPKMVEFAQYNGIPHLLMPVVTEPRKAAGALGSAVAEMEKRYHLLAENGVPNIEEYNDLAAMDASLEPMPYIVIVIDELADLMMVAGKEVEDYICRLAQKARAAGMHLIVATQRPSVDVITGLIKANIPSRIGLSVMSQIDSRTILDSGGAEKLLGNGDMLYMPVGVNKPIRVQGTFVRSAEIRGVIDFIKRHATADYNEEMIAEMEKRAVAEKGGAAASGSDEEDDAHDPILPTAVEVVIDAGQASTSLLQRRCKLGYARAARIMDEMEQMHIIGPYEGAKPRQVLITRQQWIEMTMQKEKDADPNAV